MKSRILSSSIAALLPRTLAFSLGFSLVALAPQSARATSFFWDADGATTTATGGTGIWDASSLLWRNGSVAGTLSLWPNTTSNTDAANFAATAGTVTLNSSSVDLNFNQIVFGTTGYIIAGPASGTAKLVLSGTTPTIATGTFSATINAIISGAGLTKTGTGTLTLGGANTYTGTTSITGILSATNSSALGTSAVTVLGVNGNQLQLGSGVNVGNALTIAGGGVTAQGALYLPTGNATYSGTINVTGATNAGGTFATGGTTSVLTITGNNTITTAAAVPITVRNGVVLYSGSQNYTTGTTLANSGAAIAFAKIVSMPGTGTVALSTGSSTIVNVGGTGEFTDGTGTTTAGTIGGLLGGIGGQGAPITFASGSSLGIDTTNATGTVTYGSAFTATNTPGLLKLGTGTLALTNGGTYSGGGIGGFPLIVRQGTLLLNGGTHTVTGEAVVGGTFGTATAGTGFDAKLQIDSGTLAISTYLSLGRGNGTGGVSSDIVANNGAIITAVNFSAGFNAAAGNLPKGTFTLNNTSSFAVGTAGAFNLAESAGSNMTMILNNSATATLNGNATRYIGQLGTGKLTINNSGNFTDASTGILYVGYQTGTGTIELNSGTFNHANGEVRVSGADTSVAGTGGTGTINMAGGLATVASLTVSRGNNNIYVNTGTVNVSGGAFTSTGLVDLGFAGNSNLGKLTISGTGTFNVGTTTATRLAVGRYDTSKGQLDISGGNLNLNTNSSIRFKATDGNGISTNVVNQTGGNVTFYSDNATTVGGTGVLDLMGSNTTSTNTYNLDGGTLTVPQIISTSATGTRTFNFNGGTLKAATDAVILMTSTAASQANVRNGGAIIDTNGKSVSIAQALLHSNVGGDLATDGGLTKSGVGILTLGATNTYTGTTLVSAGTLAESSTGLLLDTSALTVNGATAIFDLGASHSDTVGTVTLDGGGSITGTGTSALTSGGSFSIKSGSVSAILAGSGIALNKTTSGTVTLTGANNYSGTTTINAGSLTLSGAGSINSTSGITINGSGAKLLQTSSVASTPAITLTQGTLDGTGTVGAVTVGAGTGGVVANGNGTTSKLTLGSLIFSGGATINLNLLGGGSTTTEGLTVTGALQTSGTPGSIVVNVTPTTPLTLNTAYNLIAYGSYSSGTFADFIYGGNTSRKNGAFNNSGGFVTLTITGDTPKWTGVDNSNWVVGTTGASGNWKLVTANTATDYIQGDDVSFDDSATNKSVIIAAANVSPGSTTFNNSTGNDYTLSGGFGIAGSGPLVKSGTGKVTIMTTNTFTGPTTINAGILELGNGTTDGTIANTTGVTNNGTLAYNWVSNRTVGYPISGTGAVTKTGAGALTFSGTNSFSGGLTVNSGTLIAGSTTAFGATASTLTINGGSLDSSVTNLVLVNNNAQNWNSDLTFTGTNSLNLGTGAVTLSASRQVTVTANTLTVGGAIGGSGFSLTKVGAGTLLLSGVNTYDGGTTLNAGTLTAGSTTALGATASTLTINGGSLDSSVVNLTLVNNNAQNWNGDFSFTGTNSLNLGTGAVTLGANRQVTVTANTLTVGGAIGGSGFSLTKAGAGILALTSANAYSAGSTVNGGTLAIGGTATANSGALGAGAVTVNTGGTLRTGFAVSSNANVATVANDITLAGGSIFADDGFQHLSGALNVTSAGTLGATYNSGNNGAAEQNKGLFLDGVVSGSANLTLQQSGINTGNAYNTSIVHFTNAANTYSGTVTVTPMAGTNTNSGGSFLGLSASNALQFASVNLNGNSAGLRFGNSPIVFNTGLATATLGALSGSGNVVLTGYDEINHAYGVDTIALTVGSNNGTTAYSGVMSGAGSLTKTGSGTMTLSGLNSLTGNITINNGTLATGTGISGTLAASITSNLGDIGTAVTRSITINSGGILSLTGGNTLGTGGSTGTLAGVTLVVNSGGAFQSGSNAAGAGWWNKIGAVNLNGGAIHVGSGANNSNFQGLALIGTVTVGGSTASVIDNLGSSDSAYNAVHLGQNATTGQIITFNVADATGDSATDLTVSMKLINTSANLIASGLLKTGLGTLALSGANAYTDLTTVSAGVLNIRNGTALGTAAAGTTVSTGATLQLQGGITVGAEALSLSGVGASGQSGALVNVSGTNTFGGTITAVLSSWISALTGSVLNLAGGVDKSGTTVTFTGGGAINVTGAAISGAASNSDLVVDGAGTNLKISVASTYNGPTTVQNGGKITAGVADALPTTTALQLTTASSFDLAGFNQALSSLADDATGTVKNSAVSTTGTLTVNPASGSTTYGGVVAGTNGGLQGDLALTKAGAGALLLTGANTYTGATTVNAGTLQVDNNGTTTAGRITGSAAPGALTVNGTGTLLLSGAGNHDRLGDTAGITLNGGTLTRTGTASEGTGAIITAGLASGGANALGLGNLTLSSNSTLDFGTGGVGTLTFASFAPGAFTLSVIGYTNSTFDGSLKSGTATDDRLIFNITGGLDGAQLGKIDFGSGFTAAQISLGGDFYEVGIAPVPEPATIFGGLALLGLVGYRERRRFAGLLAAVGSA